MSDTIRVHILQHSVGTPPGSVTEWLDAKRLPYSISKLYEQAELPSLDSFDMLVIMGGPMNVDDLALHPWLAEEKAFIRAAIERKKTCLGLCLGGQLLAQVLGAEVKRHVHWEAGWHPIFIGADGPERLAVFQWHQDTFDLPSGAVRVATNRICENQGFMYSDHVVGLQFHPEATEEWIRDCANEEPYPEGPHVQAREAMLEDLVFITPMRKWFFSLLDRMETVTRQALIDRANQDRR